MKILEKAYLKARNSAAGLTNFCEEGAGVRRCEKELEEAEALFREYQASQPVENAITKAKLSERVSALEKQIKALQNNKPLKSDIIYIPTTSELKVFLNKE